MVYWNIAWSQPIPYNVNNSGLTYSGVDVTMTLTGNQPINLERELTVNNSFKYAYTAVPGVGAIPPSRHYAINVMLGTSGDSYHDEKNLKLNTSLNATVFCVTEMPLIQNYASYTLTSTTSLPSSTGCSTKFNARTYVFPSWDHDIKLIPGISFGKIKINDFKYLRGMTNPNTTIPPC